jgi:hypothetical protein
MFDRRHLAALAAVAAVAVASPARGHHGYDTIRPTATYSDFCARDNFCMTDNSTLTYFSEGSLAPYSRTQINSVLQNQFEPTDLSVSRQDPPSYSGGAETDIIYRLGVLDKGVSGWTYCDDPNGAWSCDQQYVVFGNDFWAQHITCHESGHAVGLTHGADGSPKLPQTHPSLACMKTYDNYNANGLGAHNVSQINGEY